MRTFLGTDRKRFGVGLLLGMLVPLIVSCGKSRASLASTAERAVLVQAVSSQGGRSVEGSESGLLCELAADHAQRMASARTMDHDRSSERFAAIRQAGGTDAGEIVAYTSVSEAAAAAAVCAEQWRNSAGHWAIMQRRTDAYCYTMALGEDGYYCIGLVANGL